ncbi:hypothetical protein DRQ36_08085 [bacterium]|nr:MAG: hypothetical protein DRQ36_08085 [bacterium]
MVRRCLDIIILILSILLLAFPTDAAEWTVMVYIGADNNLTDYINGDVDEMESAGSTADVNILCQIDGLESGWYNGYDDYLGNNWETVRRYRITSGSSSNNSIDGGFIADLGELNSEDPDVLRDFIIWGADNYPANRYMLIIWNHGGGWARPGPGTPPFKAIVWDDTNGSGGGIGFSNGEYAGALYEACDHIGHSLSIVGFDACIVGLLEAEYESMGYADYHVHSEASIPGDGWDYEFLQDLVADPYASEEEIVNWIVDEYAGEYGSSITLSGLRLDHDHVDFQMAVNDFARELILAGGKSNSSITNAISAAQDFGDDLVDVYDFANEIDSRNIGGSGSALDVASQTLKSALGYPPEIVGKPLVATYQSGFSGSHGVMAYTPTGTASSSWGNLDIAECNLWDEFIDGSTSLPSVKLAYWGNTLGKYIETGSSVDLYIDARNLGSGTASSVTATLSSYDSRVSISGGPANFGSIPAGAIASSSVPFNVTISPAAAESSFIPFELTFSTGKTAKFVLTAVGEVNNPPSVTVLASPFDNYRAINGNPVLTWVVTSDPDYDPLHFDVQWDTDPDFGGAATISSDINPTGFGPSVPRLPGSGNCTYTVGSQGEGAMINGLTYWWRVRAKDEYHYGPWSASRSITVNNSLTEYDWHQTTDNQFLRDNITDLGVSGNKVFLQGSVTLIEDDMEYASESEAWAVWNTYDGGSNIEVTLENRRQVSGIYSLRIRDRNSSAYGGAWRTFTPATSGVMRAWAKIYGPDFLGDMSEFLGIHDGSDYSSSFTTGLIVYGKADTLKYWDGSGHVIHTSMDSLWHYYEIEFDLAAGTSDLYVDDIHRGTFTDNGLSQITMLAVGTKLLGNAATGTAYWDDFELISAEDSDSGVIVGQPVAFDWHPVGEESWGYARWTQNTGDSIKITVQYKTGGGWTYYTSAFTTGTEGIIDIDELAAADSVRLVGVLYKPVSGPLPVLYDWTVDWNAGSVGANEYSYIPRALHIYPNYPNPFNAATEITYETPENNPVQLIIYNIKGEVVFRDDSYRAAGIHHFLFDASELPTGTYFCRIHTAGKTAERKILLLK